MRFFDIYLIWLKCLPISSLSIEWRITFLIGVMMSLYILFSFFRFELLPICSFSFKTSCVWYLLILTRNWSFYYNLSWHIFFFVFCWIIKFGVIWLVGISLMNLSCWALIGFIVYPICRLQKLRIVMTLRKFVSTSLRTLYCHWIRFVIVMMGCFGLKGYVGMRASMLS